MQLLRQYFKKDVKQEQKTVLQEVRVLPSSYYLPKGMETLQSMYAKVKKEYKLASYWRERDQIHQPTWYQKLLFIFSKNDEVEKQKNNRHLLKHLWKGGLNKKQKEELQVNLQILVLLLEDKVQSYKLSESQKLSITNSLTDGIEHCTQGFNNRVADILGRVLNPVTGMDCLITELRYELLEKALFDLEAKSSTKGDIHTRNRLTRVASGVKKTDGTSLNLGIRPPTDDTYEPQTNGLQGNSGILRMRKALQYTFARHFTPFHIFYYLQTKIMDGMVGYNGRKPAGLELSYEKGEYEKFWSFLKKFFNEKIEPASIIENPYFLCDENCLIKDVNWAHIRKKLWEMLFNKKQPYFKIFPNNSNFFDRLLQDQHEKLKASMIDFETVEKEEKEEKDYKKPFHTYSAHEPIQTKEIEYKKSISTSTSVNTKNYVSALSLQDLEEYIYFMVSFTPESAIAKDLLIKGIHKNTEEKLVFPKNAFLDIIFQNPPLLNESDAIYIINFICSPSQLDKLFPTEIAENVVFLNSWLLKMIEIGFTKAAKQLISQGASIKQIEHGSLVTLASKYGHLEMAEDFFSTYKEYNQVSNKNNQGLTALHYAVRLKNKELILFLLKNNADFSLKNNQNETPLQLIFKNPPLLNEVDACDWIDRLESQNYDVFLEKMIEVGFAKAADKLIKKGTKFNFHYSDNETPLIIASRYGHLEVIEFLLKNQKNIRINHQNSQGMTALHYAIEYAAQNKGYQNYEKNKKLILCLLKNGADPSLENVQHQTVLDLIFGSPCLLLEEDTLSLVDMSESKFYHNTLLAKAIKAGYAELARLLISKGAKFSFNSTLFSYNATLDMDLLLLAIKDQHFDLAKLLIEFYNEIIIINYQDSQGMTSLHYAIEHGNKEMALLLLSLGADLSLKNTNGKTALDYMFDNLLFSQEMDALELIGAVARKHYDFLLFNLIEKNFVEYACILMLKGGKFDVNQKNKSGMTLLHSAVAGGNLVLVEFLLERGADIDLKNARGQTAFEIAQTNKHAAIINYIETLKNELKHSDFYTAAAKGQIKKIKKILNDESKQEIKSPKIHILNRSFGCDGMTGLHAAAEAGNLKMVVFLCEEGADIHIKNSKGKTALDLAKAKNHSYVARYLENLSHRKSLLHQAIDESNITKIQQLIDRGIRFTSVDKNGMTALHIAVLKGDIKIIGLLLKKGADISFKNVSGKNALELAWENNKTDVVQYIYQYLTKGEPSKILYEAIEQRDVRMIRSVVEGNTPCNINQQTHPEKMTPLHVAVLVKDTACVKLLLEQGANPNLPNGNDKTALQLAREVDPNLMLPIYAFISQPALHRAAAQGDSKQVQKLLDRNVDVTSKTEWDQTAFFVAVKNEHFKVAQILLQKNESVIDVRNACQDTPLMWAAYNGQLKTVKLLVKNKANINLADDKGRTILMQAVMAGNTEVVRYLLSRGAKINVLDKDGRSAFYVATINNKIECTKLLLENGANPSLRSNESVITFKKQDELQNIISEYIKTPALHRAVADGDQAKVQRFLDSGVDIQTTNSDGQTALLVAAKNGYLNIAKILLDKDSKLLDAKDHLQDTPLIWAAFKGQFETVKWLVEEKANINHKNHCGRTALIDAAERGYTEIVRYLLEKGAHPDLKASNKETALHLAIRSGKAEIVKLLLENGANPNLKGKLKKTPLILAASDGQLGIVQHLIEKETDVNYQDKVGLTALMYAVDKGYIEIVRCLLKNKANPNLCSKSLETALHTAVLFKRLDIVKLLLENGANLTLQNVNGKTALELAQENGFHDIAKLIKNYISLDSSVVKESKERSFQAQDSILQTESRLSLPKVSFFITSPLPLFSVSSCTLSVGAADVIPKQNI